MRSNRKRINKRSYRRKSYRRRSSATKRKRKRSLVRRRSQRRSNIKRTYKKYRMKGGSRTIRKGKMKGFVSNRIPRIPQAYKQAYNKIKNQLKNITIPNLKKLINSFEKEISMMSDRNVMNLFEILVRRGGMRRMKGGAAAAAADGAAADAALAFKAKLDAAGGERAPVAGSVWQPSAEEALIIGQRVPGYVDLPPKPPLPLDADEREPAAPPLAARSPSPSPARALPEPEPGQKERWRARSFPGQTEAQRLERQKAADDAVDAMKESVDAMKESVNAMKESIMEYVHARPREAMGIIIFSGLTAFSPQFRAVVGVTVFTVAGTGATTGAVGLAVPDTDRERGNAPEGTFARDLLDGARAAGRELEREERAGTGSRQGKSNDRSPQRTSPGGVGTAQASKTTPPYPQPQPQAGRISAEAMQRFREA